MLSLFLSLLYSRPTKTCKEPTGGGLKGERKKKHVYNEEVVVEGSFVGRESGNRRSTSLTKLLGKISRLKRHAGRPTDENGTWEILPPTINMYLNIKCAVI